MGLLMVAEAVDEGVVEEVVELLFELFVGVLQPSLHQWVAVDKHSRQLFGLQLGQPKHYSGVEPVVAAVVVTLSSFEDEWWLKLEVQRRWEHRSFEVALMYCIVKLW